MSELGDYIRQLREKKDVSIEQAAKDTLINPSYLDALEEGNYEILPPEVYVIGFLKTYSEYLGVSADEFLNLYAPKKQKVRKKRKENALLSNISNVPSSEVVENESTSFSDVVHSLRAVPIIIYVIGFLVIFVAVVIILSVSKTTSPPETVIEGVEGDSLIFTMAPAPIDNDIAQEINIKIDKVDPNKELFRAESLTYIFRTREQVDLYVEVDYRRVMHGKLNRGEEKKWRVKNSIYIETSNPSALKISVNGFDLAPLNIKHDQSLDLRRDNILQFLEDYQPLPPGVTSAYGERIESMVPESLIMQKPSSEARKNIKRSKTPLSKTPKTQSQNTRQSIKPPTSNRKNDQ